MRHRLLEHGWVSSAEFQVSLSREVSLALALEYVIIQKVGLPLLAYFFKLSPVHRNQLAASTKSSRLIRSPSGLIPKSSPPGLHRLRIQHLLETALVFLLFSILLPVTMCRGIVSPWLSKLISPLETTSIEPNSQRGSEGANLSTPAAR